MDWKKLVILAMLMGVCVFLSAQQNCVVHVQNVYYDDGPVTIEVQQGFFVDWIFVHNNPGVYCCGTATYYDVQAVGGETNRFIVTQGDRTSSEWIPVSYIPGQYDIIYLTLPTDPTHVHRENL